MFLSRCVPKGRLQRYVKTMEQFLIKQVCIKIGLPDLQDLFEKLLIELVVIPANEIRFKHEYYTDFQGRKNGVQQVWFDNGQLRAIENYKNGKRHGIRQLWFDNGQFAYEHNYIDGKRVY